jgi:hypothetical protein
LKGHGTCIFLEAKIGLYLSSTRSSRVGIPEPSYNSTINGQLSLRYRFAKTLARTLHGAEVVVESSEMLRAYAGRSHDRRPEP